MRHPKVQERRELSAWSEGQVWGSPERPRIMKAQIDWIPLSVGSICATQGKSLAVMQVGWFSVLRCHQYPPAARPLDAHDHDPQTSVAKAYQEYDGNGRMKPSSHYDRVVDLCEELMKFTLLTRRLSRRPIQRAQGRRGEAGTARQTQVDLIIKGYSIIFEYPLTRK